MNIYFLSYASDISFIFDCHLLLRAEAMILILLIYKHVRIKFIDL